ncbi:MAG: hypothetical protein UH963_13465 [Agathobacter sp.]|nr:hypothetical protein [Agathobacter sp.]
MTEQEILAGKLADAVAFARTHKNVIAESNFLNIFGDMVADETKRNLIEGYLKEKHIIVKSEKEEEAEEPESFEMPLDDEDKKAINFYYEELKNLPHLTDREKERITKKAIEGDKAAQEKLINMYLPDVVDLAKLYTGHGVLMEDLIGEGNIALMLAVSMLECVESLEDVEGQIGKFIIEALEKLVSDDDTEEKLIIKLGEELKKAEDAKEELES